MNILRSQLSPFEELIAHEAIWAVDGMTETKFSQLFSKVSKPSEVLHSQIEADPILTKKVREFIEKKSGFSVCIRGDFQYPQRLRDAKYPVELFCYRGDLGLLSAPSVSIVGARSCSELGALRARKLAHGLAKSGFTIVSGLAVGIDTAAMEGAIEAGGRVIGVIGTPIDQYYPIENKNLQDQVAKNHLLVSQVPFYRYHKEPFSSRKHYFPRRNATMAAVSNATVIIEASEKSGTLTQARAAIQQGRPLFILNSCFENKSITWPTYYEKQGAIRVRELEEILCRMEVNCGSVEAN